MKKARTKASSVGRRMVLEAAASALLAPLALLAWLNSSGSASGIAPSRWPVGIAAAAFAAVLIASLVAARQVRFLRRQLLAWNAVLRDLQRDKTPAHPAEVARDELGHTTRRLQRLAERLARRRSLDEVLARIDEAQLVKPDRRSLVGGALKWLEIVAGGEVRALAFFDAQAESNLTVHLYVAARRRLETLRLELDAELAQRLRAVRAPESGRDAPFPEELAARLYSEAGVQHYCVLPVQRSGRPWGFLIAGHRAPTTVRRADARLLDALRQRLIAGFRSTEREELLHSLAFVDRLTGLPNREAFDTTLRQRLAGRANGDPGAAVFIVDIDRLKQVNDSFGRAVGDRLLVEARHRLGLHLTEDDVLARLGGGEFGVLLAHVIDTRSAGTAARKMIQSMARSMLIDGHRIYSGANIGIVRIPADGLDPSELVKRAGAAMVRAKSRGRHHLAFYARGMLNDSRRRSRLETDLRRALKRDELVLRYEPRVQVDGGRLCAVQASFAWQHPERGLLPAGEFIEDAETIGLAPQLGMWLLEQACRQLRCWREAGARPGRLSCRLTDGQLSRSAFADELRRLAKETKLPAGALLLEVDGAELAQEGRHHAANLAAIVEAGATLVVADFGRGAAPIAPLIRREASHLCIDINALQRQATPEAMAAIVRGLADMAHALGKRVLARGVERPLQLRNLHGLGCDEAQGPLYGGPLTREQFELEHFGRVLPGPPIAAPVPQRAAPLATLLGAPALEEVLDAPSSGDALDADALEAQLTVPMPLSEDFPLTAAG